MNCRRRLSSSLRTSAGFTLIEVLVVVVIIGVLSSVVLISIGVLGDDRDLDREARRLASLVEMVAEEAELQGRDFGLEFIRQGYRFVEYDPFFDTWTEIVGDDTLRPRRLPEDFEFALVVEDKRIELADVAADTGAGNKDEEEERRDSPLLNKYAPHTMILSSGDLSPFSVRIIRLTDDAEALLQVLPTGEIRVGEDDDEFS